MAVQMELTRIIINETSDSHIIFLKEVDGERMFPIVIGFFEASSIERRVKNQTTQRPLTHDLLANAIDLLGGDLQDIYINELREHTYFAKLRIRHEGEIVEVDSRPSDAIALAVTMDVPIYVADDIIDEVGQRSEWTWRRGARVVDWDGLENRRWCKPSVGLNPTPSVPPVAVWITDWKRQTLVFRAFAFHRRIEQSIPPSRQHPTDPDSGQRSPQNVHIGWEQAHGHGSASGPRSRWPSARPSVLATRGSVRRVRSGRASRAGPDREDRRGRRFRKSRMACYAVPAIARP